MHTLPERDTLLPPGLAGRLDPICEQFLAEWQAGRRPQLEVRLDAVADDERPFLVRELLTVELTYRLGQGEMPEPDEYRGRLAAYADAVDAAFVEADATQVEPTADAAVPAPLERAGRYLIEGLLAKGGMGVVWRARDPDLGRTLAVKVLRQELCRSSLAERRFRDEAQITARLQHPGVPPVHEVGTLPDGRPYLAMKLIDGRTLTDLLKERASPRDNVPRFLSMFEQMCQTLAYAHNCRIIHRDLKPLNVMVGAFGEVQVMDWGLAKPLDAMQADTVDGGSEPADSAGIGLTLRGSAIGTPTFMAPEQARGEHDTLDERVDVFGLGAILCVILTGCPPFQGISRHSIVARAREGDLADAFARLDACGADPELVQLTRRCLAPEREDRPRNAGEVAQAVAAHRAGVEERLRQVERERAADEARAVEARKRRRLMVALAGAVALLIAGVTFAGVQRRLEQARTDTLRALRDDFRAAIQAFDGSPEQRAALYARVGTLRHLDADTAEQATAELRQRVNETLAVKLRGSPALEQVNDFFEGVAWLRQQGWHEDAAELERRFKDQRGLPIVRSWPDGDSSAEALVPPEALERLEAPQLIPLRPACPDAAELDVVFPAAAWTGATKIAVALNSNQAHTAPLTHAAVAPNGKAVLTASADGTAKLWDLTTNRVLHTLHLGRVGVAGVGFLASDRVVVVDERGRARQWHCMTGQPMGQATSVPEHGHHRHPAAVERIVTAPDGESFVAISTAAQPAPTVALALWDTAADRPRWRLSGGRVFSAAFHPNDGTLAVAFADGSINLLDAATGAVQRKVRAPRRGDPALSLAFSADGQTLAAGTRGGAVYLMPAQGGDVVRHLLDATGIIHLAWAEPDRLLAISRSGRMSWLDRAAKQVRPGPRPQGYVLQLAPATRFQPRWLLAAGPLALPLTRAAALGSSLVPASLREAALTRQIRLTLWRDNHLLRDEPVEVRPGDALRIRLARRRGTLTGQVNAANPLVFRDPAPIHGTDSGMFALRIGPGLIPKRVTATWLTLPERPMTRDLADLAFYRQQYAEALGHLRKAERDAAAPADRRELQYKESLCLLGLNRCDEAEPLLRAVATDRNGPWALLATVQLGELYLPRDLGKARRAFAGLLQAGPDVRPQEILAAGLRDKIIGLYAPLTATPNFIRPNPERVRDLHDLEALCRLFGDDPGQSVAVRRTLVTALFRDNQVNKALALAEQLRDETALRPGERRALIEEMAWMFALANRTGEAEQLLHSQAESADRHDRLAAQLGTARMLLRAGKSAEAERILEPLVARLAALGTDLEAQHWLLAADLLRGFARDMRGDTTGAQAAWTHGYETWRRTPSSQHLYGSILASLTKRLTDEEAWRMTQGVVDDLSAGGDRVIAPMLQNPLVRTLMRPVVIRVLREMWRGPRGHDLARQVALHELGYVEEHTAQVKLGTAILVHQFCCIGLSDAHAADLDPELWNFVEQLNTFWQAGSMSERDIEQVARGLYVGRGIEAFVDDNSERLARSFRARLLLIAGHRFRVTSQRDDAQRLFHRARDLAGAGSALGSVAERAARELKEGG